MTVFTVISQRRPTVCTVSFSSSFQSVKKCRRKGRSNLLIHPANLFRFYNKKGEFFRQFRIRINFFSRKCDNHWLSVWCAGQSYDWKSFNSSSVWYFLIFIRWLLSKFPVLGRELLKFAVPMRIFSTPPKSTHRLEARRRCRARKVKPASLPSSNISNFLRPFFNFAGDGRYNRSEEKTNANWYTTLLNIALSCLQCGEKERAANGTG